MNYIPYIMLVIGIALLTVWKINFVKRSKVEVITAYTRKEQTLRISGYTILFASLALAIYLGI